MKSPRWSTIDCCVPCNDVEVLAVMATLRGVA